MSTPRARGPSAGFTLVELILGMAIGLWVLAFASSAILQVIAATERSADKAELGERLRFATRILATTVRAAEAGAHAGLPPSPCAPMTPGNAVGVRIVEQGGSACLPRRDLVSGSPLLVVEHPMEGQQSPGRQREVFFLRNYSWERGDGLGALMVKPFSQKKGTYERAEMLVAGVVDWQLSAEGDFAFSSVGLMPISIKLLLRSWREDHQAVSHINGSWGSAALDQPTSGVFLVESDLLVLPRQSVSTALVATASPEGP